MNKAIREWFDWRGWIVAGTAIVVVLGLMAILWPDFRSFIGNPSTAGWAAALGTFAAAIVSLYVAFWARKADRLDAMTDGAFELVAAGYAVQQMRGQVQYMHVRVLDLITRIAKQDARIENLQQQIAEAQEVQISASTSNPEARAERVRKHGTDISNLEMRKSALSDEWNDKLGPLAESLQAQIANVSHIKIAVFCPASGLAIVRTKAMFRRIEALSQSVNFRVELADEVQAALTQLSVVEVGVEKAERHIARIQATHGNSSHTSE